MEITDKKNNNSGFGDKARNLPQIPGFVFHYSNSHWYNSPLLMSG